MFSKLFLGLCLLLRLNADLTFDVVSTSQRPSDTQKSEQALTQLEETLKREISKINRRLDALGAQKITCSVKLEEGLTKQFEAFKEEINAQLQTLIFKSENSQKLTSKLEKETVFKSCKQVKEKGYNVSTTYLIKPDLAPNSIRVLCDLEKHGGGWTYILNRFDGSQSFDFDWKEYRQGFGDLSEEFWLGLDNIHYITGHEDNELLVELEDWDGKSVFARYTEFRVDSEDQGYKLTVSGYNGTAGDSFSYSSGRNFTTKSKDNDAWSGRNCAQRYGASWWYFSCMRCLLTGKYLRGSVFANDEGKIMYWKAFRKNLYSLKEARMLVRPSYN